MTKILKIIQFGTEVVILTLSGIELTEAIKRQMVDLASHAIFRSPPEQATAIALRYFNAFRETPFAYANFDSFMRQVRRTLQTFRT